MKKENDGGVTPRGDCETLVRCWGRLGRLEGVPFQTLWIDFFVDGSSSLHSFLIIVYHVLIVPKTIITVNQLLFHNEQTKKIITTTLTCFLSIMCFPFQYFIIPKAWRVLTISYESIAISLLISEKRKPNPLYAHLIERDFIITTVPSSVGINVWFTIIHEREWSSIKYWCINGQSFWVEFTLMWIVIHCIIINVKESEYLIQMRMMKVYY